MERSMRKGAARQRVRPEYLGPVMEAAMHGSFMVVSSPGPLSYVIKATGSDKKFKVCVGAQNRCNCMGQSEELCVHVMFVMLRVFKVDPENEVVWQPKLTEQQITALLTGTLNTNKKVVRQVRPQRKGSLIKRKPIEEGDECPICYDEMEGVEDTTWCRKGCGNNIHVHCMREWAQHHGPGATTCPYCRTEWGSVRGPPKPRKTETANTPTHHEVSCKQCKDGARISGPRFTCTNCVGYDLCGRCAADPFVHPAASHNWVVRATPNSAPRPVERASLSMPQRSGGSGGGVQGTGITTQRVASGRPQNDRRHPSRGASLGDGTGGGGGLMVVGGMQVGGGGVGTVGSPNGGGLASTAPTVRRGGGGGGVIRGRPSQHALPQTGAAGMSVGPASGSLAVGGGGGSAPAPAPRAVRSNSRAGRGGGGAARVHRGRSGVAHPSSPAVGGVGIDGMAIAQRQQQQQQQQPRAQTSPSSTSFSQEHAVEATRMDAVGHAARGADGYDGSPQSAASTPLASSASQRRPQSGSSARRGSAGALRRRVSGASREYGNAPQSPPVPVPPPAQPHHGQYGQDIGGGAAGEEVEAEARGASLPPTEPEALVEEEGAAVDDDGGAVVGETGERLLFTLDDVRSLPVAQWMEEAVDDAHVCAVCDDPFEFLDVVRTLPLCGHTLHSRCAEYWLTECSAACAECGTVGLGHEPMTYPLRPRAGSSVAFAVPKES